MAWAALLILACHKQRKHWWLSQSCHDGLHLEQIQQKNSNKGFLKLFGRRKALFQQCA